MLKNNIKDKFIGALKNPGTSVFLTAILLSVGVTFAMKRGPSRNPIIPPPQKPIVTHVPSAITGHAQAGDVKITGKTSQPKLHQNGNGEFFYEISIETPSETLPASGTFAETVRAPVDFVIVMDRSGSMASENRLQFAKSASFELIQQLGAHDRISVVSFDDSARIDVPLTSINDHTRSQVTSTIQNLQPGGSTNIGHALQVASQAIASIHRKTDGPARRIRVLLLSDGQANIGLTQPSQLAPVVKGLVAQGAVVSTIGMGLDFNQNLMANLADHGMGNYSFLESIENLSAILKKDLIESKSLYARTSEITFDLTDGIQITDAGGYPFERLNDGSNRFRVPTGQLLNQSTKTFMVTFRVPSHQVKEWDVGKLGLRYVRNDVVYSGSTTSENIRVSVVPSERDAVASINRTVYQKGWLQNNLGKLKSAIGAAVAQGDYSKAQKDLNSYRDEIAEQQRASGISLSAPAQKETAGMDLMLSDFTRKGASMDPKLVNREAKKMHLESRQLQQNQQVNTTQQK